MQFDSALELKTSGSVTSTASTTGVAFNPRAVREYTCVLYVESIETDTGNETYDATIQVSDALAGTYTTIATVADIDVSGAGKYEVPLNGAIATLKDADSAYIRVTMTIAGTIGGTGIVYGAYLTKV